MNDADREGRLALLATLRDLHRECREGLCDVMPVFAEVDRLTQALARYESSWEYVALTRKLAAVEAREQALRAILFAEGVSPCRDCAELMCSVVREARAALEQQEAT